MRNVLGAILGLVAFVWLIWSITFAGLTVFMYLGTGPDGWDAHLAYGVSLLGLVPLIGGIIASFMADTVHGWGFLHAAFNFLGFLIPFILVGLLSREN